MKKLESVQVPSCIHQPSSTNHSLSYVLAVRDWIQKIEKKEEGGGTMGPTKDRIMTKDETEDCKRRQEGGQNRRLKKAEPGEKQTRTLKKTRGKKRKTETK